MKRIFITSFILISLFFTTSCKKKESSDIITSCYPIYDLTKRIVGDKLSVSNLVKAGVEPHDYEPSVLDVVALQECKLFVLNGLGLEHYSSSLSDEIKNKSFTATSNIELIYSTHSHDNSNNIDPHVWLDPNNAIILMENIKNKICEIDQENQEYYEENFKTHKNLFLELDNKYKTTLTNLKSTYLVTSHEAFGYLCNAYNLTQLAISGLSTEDEPTASEITNIINQVRDLNVTTIFYEELVSDEIAKSIAEQTGLVCDVLNPIEGLSSNNQNDDYISLMEKNLEAIKRALT